MTHDADRDFVLERFGEFDTSTLSDALDRCGLPGACPGVLPFNPGFRAFGPAFTLRYEPVDDTGGNVGDYIDDVPDDAVVVLDNSGRTDCTVWGDILTAAASRRGISGTVINGVCRDVAKSLSVGYPVFARGRSMQSGKDRVRLAAVEVDVHIGDVRVSPGDVVVGDADGVVVISRREASRVLSIATQIAAAEDGIRAAVESGSRLDKARSAVGYHSLQSPRGD